MCRSWCFLLAIFRFEFLTEMDCLGNDKSIPVDLRNNLSWKVVKNGTQKKKKRESQITGISRGIALDVLCAFSRQKFPPFDLNTFLYLIQSLCQSLVIEGGSALPISLSKCFTLVTLTASRIRRSPSERICRGTPSPKTRKDPTLYGEINWYMYMYAATRTGRALTQPALCLPISKGSCFEISLTVHLQLRSTLSPLAKKKHIPRHCSVHIPALRCQASKEHEE